MTSYIVQPGDSLSAIAEQFGITAQALAQANNASNSDLILPGQVLVIPTEISTAFVGEGIRRAMKEDGTVSLTAEIYEFGNRSDPQWSTAIGANGTLYRWVPAAQGAVFRYRQSEQGGGGAGIKTRFGLAPPSLSAAIRRHFATSQHVNAAEISYLESSWRATALADTLHKGGGKCNVEYMLQLSDGTIVKALTEYSVGYFQINVCAHKGSYEKWIVADANVEKAADLWKRSGWRPWYLSAKKLGLIPSIAEDAPEVLDHIPRWLYTGPEHPRRGQNPAAESLPEAGD